MGLTVATQLELLWEHLYTFSCWDPSPCHCHPVPFSLPRPGTRLWSMQNGWPFSTAAVLSCRYPSVPHAISSVFRTLFFPGTWAGYSSHVLLLSSPGLWSSVQVRFAHWEHTTLSALLLHILTLKQNQKRNKNKNKTTWTGVVRSCQKLFCCSSLCLLL